MRVIGVLSRNVQLLADSIHNDSIYVVCPIRQSAEAYRQIHCILGTIHIGSDLEAKECLLRSVEDQGHRILRFQIVVNYELHCIRRADGSNPWLFSSVRHLCANKDSISRTLTARLLSVRLGEAHFAERQESTPQV